VHFKPWGISPFVDKPSSELRDRWLPVDAVWERSLDRMHDRIASPTSTGEILQILEDELRSRLVPAPSRGLELVDHTAGRLEASWGAVSVGALTDSAGVSGNHLATQFKSHLGVTPKRVARIYRFARLILSVDALHPVDWSQPRTAAWSVGSTGDTATVCPGSLVPPPAVGQGGHADVAGRCPSGQYGVLGTRHRDADAPRVPVGFRRRSGTSPPGPRLMRPAATSP